MVWVAELVAGGVGGGVGGGVVWVLVFRCALVNGMWRAVSRESNEGNATQKSREKQ